MTERGTLAQLGIKEGDVVKSRDGYTYTVAVSDDGGFYDVADFGKLSSSHDFTLISRATPPIDLTTNTSAWGLRSDEWKAAMQAHVDSGGEVEWFSGSEWQVSPSKMLQAALTYRAKPAPIVTTGVDDAWLHVWGDKTVGVYRNRPMSDDDILGTMTTTLHDGKPVRAEWVAKT